MHPLVLARLPNFFVCSLLCRLSSLSVWLLIIQRQTDLRSSAAAAKEKQERWRSSIKATGRTHEIRGQLLEGLLQERFEPVSYFNVIPVSPRFRQVFQGLRERFMVAQLMEYILEEPLVNDLERADHMRSLF